MINNRRINVFGLGVSGLPSEHLAQAHLLNPTFLHVSSGVGSSTSKCDGIFRLAAGQLGEPKNLDVSNGRSTYDGEAFLDELDPERGGSSVASLGEAVYVRLEDINIVEKRHEMTESTKCVIICGTLKCRLILVALPSVESRLEFKEYKVLAVTKNLDEKGRSTRTRMIGKVSPNIDKNSLNINA